MRTAVVMPVGARFDLHQPNSMETVARTLARADKGEVRVFCCEDAQDHGDLPVQTLPAVNRLKTLRQALADYRPDVIEFHQQTQQAVALAPHFPNAAITLYRHNAVKPPRHLIDRWRYERRYDRMDGLIFVSEAARMDFLKDFPRLQAKAFAVPNPIDVDLWRAPVEGREPLIAFAGRAMPEKGVDLTCAALPAVLARHPDWRAVLMLNDWDRHADWAAPHVAPLERFSDRVRVLKSAPLAQVRAEMQRAAIALTPSVWAEPLGLTALEAHAAGAALISSGRGGLREASGPHAVYVDDLTSSGLSRAIDDLIADPARRLSLARAAQAYVSETHTPEHRAAQLHSLRERLVQAKRS
ncbi:MULTISPECIES: glycosyltransferase family 4 protein [unclassified Brevundimonas]|uniref:glycosyltransferase family 4 protein n=1 Tax=unclassified Brevundimonas TaxID=2622653 RepID=UPI0025BAB43A|nr:MULTISPECIES: glycosyltransferase family 4 protein [unclassified Brevundimonas]